MKNPPGLPAILFGVTLLLSCIPPGRAATAPSSEVVALGGRRELFVDDHLIGRRTGLELKLHQPMAREIVMVRDQAWEGSGSDFETVMRDGNVIRMYYVRAKLTPENGTRLDKPIIVHLCYAESKDGINSVRPELGLFEFEGSKKNSIPWMEKNLDNFTPFKDTNHACPPDERYKALTGQWHKLYAMKSADGIHWSRLSEQPIIEDASPLRRYTIRIDGFVSLHARQAPGEFVSRPLSFGDTLDRKASWGGRMEINVPAGQVPMAGESQWRCEQIRATTGIPVPVKLWAKLTAMAADLNVRPPTT